MYIVVANDREHHITVRLNDALNHSRCTCAF